MDQTIVTNSFTETQNVGEYVASHLSGGNILLLYGDLGAGKTTFMQGVAKGLGIGRRIISPTFTIVRKYEISNVKYPMSSDTCLYHIDLYRTESEENLKGIGLEEILLEKRAIVAIEWPEKLGGLVPERRWEVRFEWLTENERKITIEKF
jgi:tRNA threonylcarbamoyladenosine biosynthesis protein TsaE